MSRDQLEMDENSFWIAAWSRALVVAILAIGGFTYSCNTPEAKCSSACGVFAVEHVNARECVCSERRR